MMAQMKVTHELTGRSAAMERRDGSDQLSFVEFLEALTHVAHDMTAEEIPLGAELIAPDEGGDALLSQKLLLITRMVLGVMEDETKRVWTKYFASVGAADGEGFKESCRA